MPLMRRKLCISIHAPTRGATQIRQSSPIMELLFQSTLLQEERLKASSLLYLLALFQSTLLQEERPGLSTPKSSITNFNPRSYKRSDGRCTAGVVCAYKFQSTLLQEERRSFSGAGSSLFEISIHAPTRGATVG